MVFVFFYVLEFGMEVSISKYFLRESYIFYGKGKMVE